MTHQMPEENELPEEWESAVALPITEVLDLHTFSPKEIESLLSEYFLECRKIGIQRVRVIHGKGTGAMRERVHRFCERSIRDKTGVIEFLHPAPAHEGSWGATWVLLQE